MSRWRKRLDDDGNIRGAYWALHNATRYIARLALLTNDESSRYHRDHELIAKDMLASVQRWERQLENMWLDHHEEWELHEYPEEH